MWVIRDDFDSSYYEDKIDPMQSIHSEDKKTLERPVQLRNRSDQEPGGFLSSGEGRIKFEGKRTELMVERGTLL